MEEFNLIFNLNIQIQVNKFLVWTLNSSPWIELVTRCKQDPLVQVSSKLQIPRRDSSKFYRILNLEASLIFHSHSTLNLKKFLWRKLFLS
jgi:hypothetical protein